MIVRIILFFIIYILGMCSCGFLFFGNPVGADILFAVAVVIVAVYELIQHESYRKGTIYKVLEEYVRAKDPSVKLFFYKDKVYNAKSAGKRYIMISSRWCEDMIEHPEHLAFIKSTVCHELYHLKQGHPIFSMQNILFYFRSEKVRDQIRIGIWKEEFEADRYGYEIFEDKEAYLAKMEFCREHATRRKKTKKYDHPTWEMRIRYIKEDVAPTLERVTKEYNNHYGIRETPV